jgi:uncharacterized protein (DUF1778 family)
MAVLTSQPAKDCRFQLRASARDETLIKTAAEQLGMNVTEFIINTTREKAEEMLARQTRFVLQEHQWKNHGSLGPAPGREADAS